MDIITSWDTHKVLDSRDIRSWLAQLTIAPVTQSECILILSLSLCVSPHHSEIGRGALVGIVKSSPLGNETPLVSDSGCFYILFKSSHEAEPQCGTTTTGTLAVRESFERQSSDRSLDSTEEERRPLITMWASKCCSDFMQAIKNKTKKFCESFKRM